jgi:hypothetical protein
MYIYIYMYILIYVYIYSILHLYSHIYIYKYSILGNKEAILAQAKQQEINEMSQGNTRPQSHIPPNLYI